MSTTLMIGSGILTCEPMSGGTLATEPRRGDLAGCRGLLGADRQVARLQLAAYDLGETIVVQPGHHRNRCRLTVAQNPNLGVIGLSGPHEAFGNITQRLVWHADHIVAL